MFRPFMAGQGSVINVVISADTNDVNLRTLAGSPSTAVQVVCTIAAGIKVGATLGYTQAAFRTGAGWVVGTTLRLVLGTVAELNGASGASGGLGGDALSLSYDLTIDNGGYIRGGGGGGGNGGPAAYFGSPGSGGEGQGSPSNLAGPTAGTSGTGDAGSGGSGGPYGSFGDPGSDGGLTAGGAGGAAGYAIRKNSKVVTWISGNNYTQVVGTAA